MAFLKTKKSLGMIGSFHNKHESQSSPKSEKTMIQTERQKSEQDIIIGDYSVSDEIIIPRKGKSASSDISVNSAKFSLASSIKSNWSRFSKKFRFSADNDRKSDWKTRSLYVFKKNKPVEPQDVTSNVMIELKYPYRTSILTFKNEFSKEYRNSFRLCVEQQSALQQMMEDYEYCSSEMIDAITILSNVSGNTDIDVAVKKMISKLEEILQNLEDLKGPLDSQPISYADLSPLNVAGLLVEYQIFVFGAQGCLNELFKLDPNLFDFVPKSKRILCSYSQCTQERRVEVGELRSAISKLQGPIRSLYAFYGKRIVDNFQELEKLELSMDTTKCRTLFPEKQGEDITIKNAAVLIFLTIPYQNYQYELVNCSKLSFMLKCVEVSFKKKIKYSNTKLDIFLLEDTLILTERIQIRGKDDQIKLLMPPVPLNFASIKGLVIGTAELLQLTLHSSYVLTVSSQVQKEQELFLAKFNSLQEKMITNQDCSSPILLLQSKYPKVDTESALSSVSQLRNSVLTVDSDSKSKILYLPSVVFKLNGEKEWGSLGKTETFVYKSAQKYWIEFRNPDTKRCIFTSLIHLGTIAKLEGNFVRLIFPQKLDSAIFGIKVKSDLEAEKLFQIIKRAMRAHALVIWQESKDLLILDGSRISWSHLRYQEVRSSLEKFMEMIAPNYAEFAIENANWNKRLKKFSLKCLPLGDFKSAFCCNGKIFLGHVQVTLYNYGIDGELDSGNTPEILASRIIIRSSINPNVIYLCCGVERLKVEKSSNMSNLITLVIDSKLDYSLSCKDSDHFNSTVEFFESCIDNAHIFKQKYTEALSKYTLRTELLKSWKSKAKELETEEINELTAKEVNDKLSINTDDNHLDQVRPRQEPDSNINDNHEDDENLPDTPCQLDEQKMADKCPISVANPNKMDHDNEQILAKGISDVTLREEPLSIENRRQKLVSSMENKVSKDQIKLEHYQQKLLENNNLLTSAEEETKKLKEEFVELLLENARLKQEIYNKS